MTQHLIGQPQGVGMLGSMASPSIEQVEETMKKQTPLAAGSAEHTAIRRSMDALNLGGQGDFALVQALRTNGGQFLQRLSVRCEFSLQCHI